MKNANHMILRTCLLALGTVTAQCRTAAPEVADLRVTGKTTPYSKNSGLPDSTVGILSPQKKLCTGTLINSQVVLTAAQCAIDENGKKGSPSILIGHLLKKDVQQALSKEVAIHPKFDSRKAAAQEDHYDLALLHLSEPLASMEVAKVSTNSPISAEAARIVGFGETDQESSGNDYNRVLNIGSTRIQNFKGLQEFEINGSLANMANICFGDSGGPVFGRFGGKWELIGVASTGTIIDDRDEKKCGKLGYAGRLDIAEVRKWIQETAGLWKKTIDGIPQSASTSPNSRIPPAESSPSTDDSPQEEESNPQGGDNQTQGSGGEPSTECDWKEFDRCISEKRHDCYQSTGCQDTDAPTCNQKLLDTCISYDGGNACFPKYGCAKTR